MKTKYIFILILVILMLVEYYLFNKKSSQKEDKSQENPESKPILSAKEAEAIVIANRGRGPEVVASGRGEETNRPVTIATPPIVPTVPTNRPGAIADRGRAPEPIAQLQMQSKPVSAPPLKPPLPAFDISKLRASIGVNHRGI